MVWDYDGAVVHGADASAARSARAATPGPIAAAAFGFPALLTQGIILPEDHSPCQLGTVALLFLGAMASAESIPPRLDGEQTMDTPPQALPLAERLLLGSRGVMGQDWRHRLFFQVFPRGHG